MTSPVLLQSFNAGEISPELYGEVDLAKYKSAATTFRNMFVQYKGGASSRGGLALVGRCKQSILNSPPRPIPFQFSITQGLILEFGNGYIRFIYQGGYVLEPVVSITGATQANPCQINVVGTPYSNGDWFFIYGVVGMTQLNGGTYIVAGAAAGHFTLQDLNGNNVDSTAYTAYTSGGSVARIYEISSPYDSDDLPYLKFSQSADVMTLTCSNPVTGTEYPPYDLTRLSNIDWQLTQTNFDPVIAAPSSVSASANTQAPDPTKGSGINATFAYQVTAVDKKGNESIASATATCHGADLQVEGGTNTITWSFVPHAKYYNVYRAPPSVDSNGKTANPVPAGSIFGFVGSAYGTQFLDTASVTDLTQTPPTHENPFAPGQILAVDITSAGSGLSAVTWSITTGGGSNFSGYPAVAGGALGAFPIVNPGKNYQAGDTIAFNGAGFAGGAITFAANPSNNDTITLNGVVWTFKTTVGAGNQTKIQGALVDTLNQLVSDLSASPSASLRVASYAVDNTSANLLITYNTAGVGGNAYTLAASVATPSGATLTGGGGIGGSAPTATLDIGPETGTYPGVNAYFQQRRFYANSFNDPDTFWASQTGRFSNFDTRIPSVPDDSIEASPWTEQVNGIGWLVPMPGGLIAMTGRRAWQIIGEGSYQLNVQPITPSSTQAQPQAFNGCSATIPPTVIDYDVIYVEAISESVVRDLSWNFWVNIYTGADLTVLSSQLFQNRKIVQWAWSRSPHKILWVERDDGIFLSLTYLKEQEVYGWARHDTLGFVKGIAAITEPPADAPYFVTQRFLATNPSKGAYYMERMDNRLWFGPEDAYSVDCGVSNPMTSPNADVQAGTTSGVVVFLASESVFNAGNVGQILRMAGGIATISTYTSGFQISGTWILSPGTGALGKPYASSGFWSLATPVTSLKAPHFAGTTGLVGLADGVPLSGLYADALGTITLPFAASNVKVGLPFTAQLQTPYLNEGQPTMQGGRKIIPAVTVRVTASAAFQVGTNQPDGSAMNPPQIAPQWSNMAPSQSIAVAGAPSPGTYTSPGGRTVTQLWTGDLRQVVTSAWVKPGQVAIQQTQPMALEITAVIPEVLPGDTPETAVKEPAQGDRQQPRPPGRWMLAS